MKVIGLTGLNAAGKGEVGNYLISKGYIYYSLSDAIRDELRKENVELTRENLINKGNELRTNFGPGILGKKTAEKITDNKNYVIDSIRNPKEVDDSKRL